MLTPAATNWILLASFVVQWACIAFTWRAKRNFERLAVELAVMHVLDDGKVKRVDELVELTSRLMPRPPTRREVLDAIESLERRGLAAPAEKVHRGG